MFTPDRRHWLVYNGMLYNHHELRNELRPRYAFRGSSDTEVVLAALATWGISALRRFEGMFAFLWWDSTESALIGAVDPLGIKPLLYRRDRSGVLACSSEQGPLLDIFPDSSVDTDALGAYLADGMIDHSSHTLIREVRQLRRGEYLRWTRSDFSIHRYCELIADQDLRTGDISEEDAQVAVRNALNSAVNRHVMSEVPVGLGLSSGLDSNILRMVLKQEVLDHAVQTFMFTFPGSFYDESQRLAEMEPDAARETIQVPLQPQMVIDHLPHIINRTLEPLGGLGTFGLAMKYRAVSERGYRVMLSGEGADDLFGGYTYHRRSSSAQEGDTTPSSLKSVVRASDGSFLSRPLLNSGFSFEGPPANLGSSAELHSQQSALRREMWADMVALRLPKLLRYRDRMSMHYSVEARVPFLDAAVLRVSLGLADQHLVRGSTTKVVLRAVAAKGGFGRFSTEKFGHPVPQREWIKGPLGAWINDLVDDSMLVKAGIIDGEGFRRQLSDYRASAELGNSFFAWQFANLELWMRAFESRRVNGSLMLQRQRTVAQPAQSSPDDAVAELGRSSS
jgi:asparagine synthase (glutamine-hydrolysing)